MAAAPSHVAQVQLLLLIIVGHVCDLTADYCAAGNFLAHFSGPAGQKVTIGQTLSTTLRPSRRKRRLRHRPRRIELLIEPASTARCLTPCVAAAARELQATHRHGFTAARRGAGGRARQPSRRTSYGATDGGRQARAMRAHGSFSLGRAAGGGTRVLPPDSRRLSRVCRAPPLRRPLMARVGPARRAVASGAARGAPLAPPLRCPPPALPPQNGRRGGPPMRPPMQLARLR
jgi:hypothetical protein